MSLGPMIEGIQRQALPTARRSRVLFLCHHRPYPVYTGTLLRIHHLAVGLAARHRLTLVVPPRDAAGDPTPPELWPIAAACEAVVEAPVRASQGPAAWGSLARRLYRLVRHRTPYYLTDWDMRAYARFLCERFPAQEYDAVWACKASLAEAARLAGYRRVVVDIEALTSSEFERQIAPYRASRGWPLLLAELWKLRRYERQMGQRFDHVVFCNPDEAAKAGTDPARVSVVANGYEFPAALPPADAVEPDNILFVGLLNYDSNVDAVHYFVAEVLPRIKAERPNAAFHVVGRSPAPSVLGLHNGRDCFVHGTVPDVVPYLTRAAVVVAPIRMGAGTRLKVIEGLAYGKPIVATRTAVEGLDLRPGVDAAVVDDRDPVAFAEWCIKLLTDADLRATLGRTGRLSAMDRYDWCRIIPAADRALLGRR